MKILVCQFHQESNSFNPLPSGRKDYEKHGIYVDQEILTDYKKEKTLLYGILQELKAANAEIVPASAMWSDSAGPVEQAVVDEFMEKTLAVIRENLPFDGACVSLHGATQSTEMEDVCGYILSSIRKAIGPEAVITAGFDLHANITSEILNNTDYICGYQTYPHVDFFETGVRTAKLCVERIHGKKPYRAYAAVPMIAAASGYTTLHGRFGELMTWAKSLPNQKDYGGGVIDVSIFQAQPWLDVSCNAGAVAVVTANCKDTATQTAEWIATQLWDMRKDFLVELPSVEDVLRISEENHGEKPVLLVDSSDSVNAGACGDSAFVLQKILETGSPVKAALQLIDPPAVEKAMALGVGAEGTFTIGAANGSKVVTPVTITARVVSLHDGEFINEGPALARQMSFLGPSAVLRCGNVDVLVTTSVTQPGDPQFYRHFGIEPFFYQMLVVKACTSFRAAFEPIASQIIYADTPGAASANLEALPFVHVNREFFPFKRLGVYAPRAYLA